MILTRNDALFCGVDDGVESGGVIRGFNVVIEPDSFYQTSSAHQSCDAIHCRVQTTYTQSADDVFNFKTVGPMPTYYAVVRMTFDRLR